MPSVLNKATSSLSLPPAACRLPCALRRPSRRVRRLLVDRCAGALRRRSSVCGANPVRKVPCNEPVSRQHEGHHSKRRTESPGAGCILVYGGDEACPETSPRVCLCAKTTKETPPLPMMGLRPVVVSGPARSPVRTTTAMNPAASTDSQSTREHARRPRHAQPASSSSRTLREASRRAEDRAFHGADHVTG